MTLNSKKILYTVFILIAGAHQCITAESAASAESEFRVLPGRQTMQAQPAGKPFMDPRQLRYNKEEWKSSGKGRWGRRGDIQKGGHGRKRMNDSRAQNVNEQQQKLANQIARTQENQLDSLVKFERLFGKNSLTQETYDLLNKNQEAISKTIEELRPVQNAELPQ